MLILIMNVNILCSGYVKTQAVGRPKLRQI